MIGCDFVATCVDNAKIIMKKEGENKANEMKKKNQKNKNESKQSELIKAIRNYMMIKRPTNEFSNGNNRNWIKTKNQVNQSTKMESNNRRAKRAYAVCV